MEIILKEDFAGLGYKNDIVKVRNGYGRNYLLPRGLAILATDSNKKIVAENIKQAAHKAEKIKATAQALADQLGGANIEIVTKAGESGKIFGAVTSLQIAESLREKGIEVDRKKISFKSEVKNVGEYVALVDLHKEVKKEITFKVVAG
ncbi:MAG: 50S ribosomal protein L9 [Bernardetiaceae bacterium]|jgi:large subunit ribosomal protein L9|nr:50S ribosomal protein L9 [Bernardetiaceae bacterium]